MSLIYQLSICFVLCIKGLLGHKRITKHIIQTILSNTKLRMLYIYMYKFISYKHAACCLLLCLKKQKHISDVKHKL